MQGPKKEAQRCCMSDVDEIDSRLNNESKSIKYGNGNSRWQRYFSINHSNNMWHFKREGVTMCNMNHAS